MKKYIKYFAFSLFIAFVGCKEDYKYPLGGGNPSLDLKEVPNSAFFGDSLSFKVGVTDQGTALSTLKVQLYYSEDLVSEHTIRTKEYGDYSGKIYVPYLANIPNGTATLKFVLQNVGMVTVEETKELPLSRPDFPFLNLIVGDETYKMEKVSGYEYAVTEDFPQKVQGYIQAPAYGEHGNVINFGWEGDNVKEGTMQVIPFSNYSAGNYKVQFNTLTYAAAPFVSYKINDTELTMVDDNTYFIDLQLENGAEINIDGIADIDTWWIDSDYLKHEGDKYTFQAISGKYKITAKFDKKYFIVEAMNGNDLATLNADGTGAIWIIGDGIGKPALSNQVGWDTGKALCMAPIGDKKYQVTVVAGQQVRADDINFKFFHQKNWGGEFKNDNLTTDGDVVYVGDGDNGRDPGNLGIQSGKTLDAGATYVFVVDVSGGVSNAKLTVTKK